MEALHAKRVVQQLGISNCYSLPLFTQLFPSTVLSAHLQKTMRSAVRQTSPLVTPWDGHQWLLADAFDIQS